MKEQTKQNLIIVAFGVLLFVGLNNLPSVLQFLGKIADIILPIIIGGTLAFVLSVPMRGFEKLVDKVNTKYRWNLKRRTINTLSLVATLLSLVIILVIISLIVVPEVIKSVNSIIEQFKIKWPEWKLILDTYNLNTDAVIKYFESSSINDIMTDFMGDLAPVLYGITDVVSFTASIVINIIFSAIVTFYLLLFKKDLANQVRRLMRANLKDSTTDKLISLWRLLKETYTKFLIGQSIESLILGGLMLVALSIFRLPYALLIALLTLVCSFIPYIGAFISCGIGVFLTLLSSPIEALTCLVVYQVVQFIEGQFIYPRVVGNSVGMSPLYTFLAVLIGGKLFGIVGILFFIPLTAVIYTIVRDDINKKLANKNNLNRE